MNDIEFYRNIIYQQGTGFYLIDTTSWKEEENQDKINIYKFNESIFFHLIKLIFDYSEKTLILKEIESNYSFLKNNPLSRELYRILDSNFNNDFHIALLLEAYKDFVKTYYGSEIETIGDIKKYTKIMKKS